MKLFLSWSGDESKNTAERLKTWLILLFPSLEIWISSRDLVAGDRWHDQLSKELELTDFGIICLNAENSKSPWVLYEAGALSKSVDQGRIIPLLTGLNFADAPDPLKHFQAVKENREGLKEIIRAISVAMPENHRDDAALDTLFELLFDHYDNSEALTTGDSIPAQHGKPIVKFLRANGLIVEIDNVPVTLTEREYVAYFFLCFRSSENQPSIPYYKAVPPELMDWLLSIEGVFSHGGLREWRHQIEHYGGFEEFQRTVSSIRRKFRKLDIDHIEDAILPQRGRIGVVITLEQDILSSH